MAMEAWECSSDDEEMQLDYEEAVNDVVELQAELRSVESEAQQLRIRLQAVAAQHARSGHLTVNPGPSNGSMANGAGVGVPPQAALPTAAAVQAEERRVGELRTLLEWLSQHVELGVMEILDVGFEVPIGGRIVHLRRVAQWHMPSAPGGRLRLSVPVEHLESIAQLLSFVKANKGKVDIETARRFAAVWDLVPGELATAAPPPPPPGAGSSATGGGGAAATGAPSAPAAAANPEPSVLLAHRGSTQGILVATWPTREALEAFNTAGVTAATAPRAGDRVQVEYEGKWYSGILHLVDSEGKASVKCDADPDGVLTVAPLCRVRRLSGGGAGPMDPGSAAAPAAAAATSAKAAVVGAVGENIGKQWRPRDKAASIGGPGGTPTSAGEAGGDEAGSAELGTPAAAAAARAAGHRRTRSSAL